MTLKQKALKMRDAINDVELALSCDEILGMVELFEAANDDVKISVPLGVLRQLALSYPALNAIANDPAFNFSEFQ